MLVAGLPGNAELTAQHGHFLEISQRKIRINATTILTQGAGIKCHPSLGKGTTAYLIIGIVVRPRYGKVVIVCCHFRAEFAQHFGVLTNHK